MVATMTLILKLTIHRNQCTVCQLTLPKFACIHACMRLIQCRREEQNTGVNIVATVHSNCCFCRNHTRWKWGICFSAKKPLKGR